MSPESVSVTTAKKGSRNQVKKGKGRETGRRERTESLASHGASSKPNVIRRDIARRVARSIRNLEGSRRAGEDQEERRRQKSTGGEEEAENSL